MSGRYTKKLPEFVYFWGTGDYINGPYVRPQQGRTCRKYKLTEVPMDEPKKKKAK